MKLHATVELKEDLPEHGLKRGAIGVIVAILEVPHRAYEVEFADAGGRAIAEVALEEEQIEAVAVERGPL